MEPLPIPAPGERTSQTVRRFRDVGGPVVPIELPGKVNAWMVCSYESVSEVLLNDGTLYSKNAGNCPALHDGTIPPDWPLRQLVQGDHLLTKDGDDHRRLRGLVNRAFTPARVAAMAPRIQELTDGLLDRMAGAGEEVDLVRYFSEPLPIAVICELFGVPEEERRRLREWTNVLLFHTATPQEAGEAAAAMLGYLHAFIERKRVEPGDDLTSGLIAVQEDDGDRLSDDEMLWILWLVLIAGHETTVHMIANAVVALCADPAVVPGADDQDAWEKVVEEALRSRNSVLNVMFRYPLQDVQVTGTKIPAGELIVVGLGGAGTDPARYGPDAERFDPSREPDAHVGFGRGPHFCLGAPLARLEVRIALSSLFGRYPGLRLAVGADEIDYTPSLITEGPVRLPVVLGPRS
ncbi:cytochrome P450 family protein [Nonomuraea gerenzanensis]|uniref:Putative cytochrome P450 hydroxylase n=1 Tax=Nonomuraea gerenzanensis TaxID=93944 RepID=A0A1M4EQD8_9ACTN|nr:cytochrome P450 [Nonomuraea gerenzanensis]UBU12475.1 cytochrome P450 [Nonomuraea gerenzanensis]SBP01027.1 putative cytochrome P450 hydroxylase [Nonomuraea gerenzanensis]